MIKTITHKGILYPEFQTNGNAARFCRPFALEVCQGEGVDVGCNRPEWAFVDKNGKPAILCDPTIGGCEAMKLPVGKFDYIHSSHAAEHFPDWVEALEHWYTKLKIGGTLFLYLPDFSQCYWRPWSNRKHIHIFTPEFMREYLLDHGGYRNIFVSGVDAYNSFIAMAEKKEMIDLEH